MILNSVEAWDKALDWVWDLEEDLELISVIAEDLAWVGVEEEDSGNTQSNLIRYLEGCFQANILERELLARGIY
jgi:hypothetical protein